MAPVTLAEDIRQRLGECSPAERKVGRVLLAGWPAAGFETIATLAERADVSAPTVIRFVNRLGYRGFPDFQAALRAELDERQASPLTLYAAGKYGSSAEAGQGEPSGRRPARPGPGGLHRGGGPHPGRGHAPRPRTGRPTARRPQAPRHPRRRPFQPPLRPVPGPSPDADARRRALPPGPAGRAHRAPRRPGQRDVLVVFDYRRYEDDKVTVAELVREAGGRVVLFTDTWLSPVSTQAEVVLSSQVGAPSPYDSLVPTLAVVETVVAGIIGELGDGAHQHMQRGEQTARRIGLT
ncbi:MurR/RpiR family transcriptional regulator [Kitasatospora arboriphila]